MRTLMMIVFAAALAAGCSDGKKSGTGEKKDPTAEGSKEPPAGLKPMGTNPHMAGAGMGATEMPVLATPEAPKGMDFSGIEKAEGGHTIEELYAKRADLAGGVVKVRGRVVKFSPQIMGTNWVHVQDGTGAKGSNDLTLTTDEELTVGDTVLAEGPLSVDQTLGHGMKYTVLVQSAKIVVEKKD